MGAKIQYRRRPAGMRLQVNYLLGEERNREDGSSETDNEARGLFKGDYDVTELYFVYISNDLEYDETDQFEDDDIDDLMDEEDSDEESDEDED